MFILLVAFSCKESAPSSQKQPLAKGGKVYGSGFRFSVPYKISSVFPYSNTSLYEQQISSLCYEPLFRVDEKGGFLGVVASKYIYSKKENVLRIVLRKKVPFHKHSVFEHGVEFVNSSDVAFSIAFACSSHPKNNYSYLFENKIVGFQEFFSNSSSKDINFRDLKGIKIINEYTLDLFLSCSKDHILSALSNSSISILNQKAFLELGNDFFSSYIGTGAFCSPSFSNNSVKFFKNVNYYRRDEYGNQLPFLDDVEVFFNSNQVSEFEKGGLDIIQNASSVEIKDLFGSLENTLKGGNVLHKTHVLKDNELVFLAFNERFSPFKSVSNRQAIASLIDRNALVAKNQGDILLKFAFLNGSIERQNNNHSFSYKRINTDKPLCFVSSRFKNENDSLLNSLIFSQLNQRQKAIKFWNISTVDSLFSNPLDSSVAILKLNWISETKNKDDFLGLFYSHSSFAKHLGIYDEAYDKKYIDLMGSKASLNKSIIAENHLIEACHLIPLFSSDLIFLANIEMRDLQFSSSGIFHLERVYRKPVNRLLE